MHLTNKLCSYSLKRLVKTPIKRFIIKNVHEQNGLDKDKEMKNTIKSSDVNVKGILILAQISVL